MRQLLSIRKKDQLSVQEFREDFERFARLLEISAEVDVQGGEIAGVPVEWVRAPEAEEDGRSILFLHGGGYVGGSLDTHRAMVARLSAAAASPVVAVDYRRAPEFPFPAAFEDATAVYRRWMEEPGADPLRRALVGDSAGGGLALATIMTARDDAFPRPAALALVCPWVDLTLTGASMESQAERDPILRPPVLRRILPDVLAGADPRDPRISPLFGDLRDLPPILLQVGTLEILLDDSLRLADRIQGAGGEVRLEVWEGMVHDWHLFASMIPEGAAAIRRIGTFLKGFFVPSAILSEEARV